MTGRAGRLRRLLAASLTAGMFLLTASAGAAQSGVTVTVQDNYQADYGVTIPFTRSPRTTDYTFSLYEGGSAAGAPVVSAKVEMTAAQEDVYLPLAYDITGPQSYTLKIEARPLPGRIGTDTAAAREFSFTTKPTCGCASGTAGAFYRGSGSAADPFYVGSQQQLAHVGAHSAANIYQDRDIALSGNWAPIASFSGTYDGGGHKVTGLKVNEADTGGLFSRLEGATVQNLALESVTVKGNTVAASLAAHAENNSFISNCCATGRVEDQGDFIWPERGGLIGHLSQSTIENCYFAGVVSSSYGTTADVRWIGGIAAVARNRCTIRQTWNLTEYQVSASNDGSAERMSGGVAGDISLQDSQNNFFPGSITSSANYWGASGTGGPTHGIANTSNNPTADNFSDDGCTQIFSFSSLPAGFDPSVWGMGTVTVPTLSGGSKTVAAPVLKVFQP